VDDVSVVIPTRGDVDCDEIVCSFPPDWEVLLWNNGEQMLTIWRHPNEPEPNAVEEHPVTDLGVYARYAAIEYASHDIILTQDDDCIVSDPKAIVDTYEFLATCPEHGPMKYGEVKGHWGWVCWHDDHDRSPFSTDAVVCNMPQRFRGQGIYATNEHALVGFGAAFHRDAPQRAFDRLLGMRDCWNGEQTAWFDRTCDIVFTALTPRVLVDVPHEDLPHAHAPNRMWKQKTHQAERQRMLELVKQVK
jgi:hypothetical protein